MPTEPAAIGQDASPSSVPPGDSGKTADAADAGASPTDDAATDDALYVAPTGSDSAMGTRSAPLATVQAAVSRAPAAHKTRVRICVGTYREAVTLAQPIRLEGGLDCHNGWVDATERSELAPGSGTPLTVRDVQGPVAVVGLRLRAPDALTPGDSSIAMFVRQSAAVSIEDSALIAGNGADGAVPAAPAAFTWAPKRAADGQSQPGEFACAAAETRCTSTAKGGATGIIAPAGAVRGGRGGDGASATIPEQPGASADPSSLSSPGTPPGRPGVPGAPGAIGTPASQGIGQVTSDGYTAANRGLSGTNGLPGGGGGGGNGGRAYRTRFGDVTVCPYYIVGGGGGEGGVGGSGGKGADGSGAGGASIGLLSVHSHVGLKHVTIDTGAGGNGGDAVPGAVGQPGGLAGKGGKGSHGADNSTAGCFVDPSGGNAADGGDGAQGGNGGAGGPGGGGPSIGALVTDFALTQTAVVFGVGKGGRGGLAVTGQSAVSGDSAPVYPPSLAGTP